MTKEEIKEKLRLSKDLNQVLSKLCHLDREINRQRNISARKIELEEEKLIKFKTESTRVVNQIRKIIAQRDNKLLITIP
jgi:hypothetical protein